MEATPNSPFCPFSDHRMLESFFETYPPEKADLLLWRWVLAAVRNDFSRLTDEDFWELSDFFERLHQLEHVFQDQYIQLRQKQGREGA